ncbi:tyrosine-type recombinase/integrase [Bacillus altitudinis]|uniref:tyrosine-type recombinase/integrase n=1 Tax=Bacillus altitudinis TaxID=293387 RepID=UPI00366B52BB
MDYLCFVTLAYTGMRVSELLALKWTDIDFTKKAIRITKTYYNPNNVKTGYELKPIKMKQRLLYQVLSLQTTLVIPES